MSLKLIREQCPRCGGRCFLEPDMERYGQQSEPFHAIKCWSCSGIVAYVAPDGTRQDTDAGAAARAMHRAEQAKPPERVRLISTRDWVREELGDATLPIAEELDAGTYGGYAPEPAYAEDAMTTKRCPECPEPKPVSEFYRNRSSKDGLSGYCKPHHKARVKASYARAQAREARIRSATPVVTTRYVVDAEPSHARAQARKHEAPRVVRFPKESAIVTALAREHVYPEPEPSLFRRLLSHFKRTS